MSCEKVYRMPHYARVDQLDFSYDLRKGAYSVGPCYDDALQKDSDNLLFHQLIGTL